MARSSVVPERLQPTTKGKLAFCPVRVVMTLLVRDEADIVDCNLAYHLARGVDAVIVTDHRSQDGTRERLEAWARDEPERVHLLREDGEEVQQAAWVTRMARKAERELDADWILNDDADELYWPEVGDDLKAALAKVPHRFGALELPRVNFVARPEDGRRFYDRMTAREAVSTDAIGRALRPKVAHRANPRMFVSRGSHAVRGAPPLLAHMPQAADHRPALPPPHLRAVPPQGRDRRRDAWLRAQDDGRRPHGAAVRAARGALPRGDHARAGPGGGHPPARPPPQ